MRLTDFYPRPPRGGRPLLVIGDERDAVISIHALREEGDTGSRPKAESSRISIHALREEGDALLDPVLEHPEAISIHALREEGDHRRRPAFRRTPISIHALREEGDLDVTQKVISRIEFLSTPSARRATKAAGQIAKLMQFLSTPSARRATCGLDWNVSIYQFLSTPSARRATEAGRMLGASDGDFYPRPPRGGRRSSPPMPHRSR